MLVQSIQKSNSVLYIWATQVALVVKNPPANTGYIRDSGSIPVICLYVCVCVYFKLFSTLGYYTPESIPMPSMCSITEAPCSLQCWGRPHTVIYQNPHPKEVYSLLN